MIRILENAELYCPSPQGKGTVVIAAGKILWLGKEKISLPSPLPVETIDLDGKRLIPGLIDCHVHLTGGGGEAGFKSRVPPLGLSDFTRYGTTAAVGVLGTDDTTRNTESLVAAARGLREEGFNAYCLTGGYHIPPVTLNGSVRRDIIHVDPIIGVGEIAISDHRSSQPTLEEILRLASDAHLAGLLTGKAGIAHFHLGDGERRLDLIHRAVEISEIPPRVFHPTHVNRKRALFEDALSLVERGCNIDATTFPVEEYDDAYTAAESVRRYLHRRLPLERLTVSSDAGGSLPSFDDKGVVVGMGVGGAGALIATLRELLAEFPLEDVLPIFTLNVAKLLRLPTKGRIAAGACADLIALNSQGQVSDVILGGRFHVRDEKQLISGTFESPDTGPERDEETASEK